MQSRKLNWQYEWSIDRYRCGPENSNWTQTDRKMADRYRYGPKNSNWHGNDQSIWVRPRKLKLNWQDEWPIDIGAVPNSKLKLTRRWPIDIGAVWTRLIYAHWLCLPFYILHVSWAWYFFFWSICLFLFSTQYFHCRKVKACFHIHTTFERFVFITLSLFFIELRLKMN